MHIPAMKMLLRPSAHSRIEPGCCFCPHLHNLGLLKTENTTSRSFGSSQFTSSTPQINQGFSDLGESGRWVLHPPFPNDYKPISCSGGSSSNEDRFCFCPLDNKNVTKSGIAYNGLRVYEPARRAQAVAILILCNRRDRRAGCRRPSDDQREERCVKPLLAAFVASVYPPALPRTAGPYKTFVFAFI